MVRPPGRRRGQGREVTEASDMAGQQSDLSSVPPKTNHLGATKSDTTRPGRSFVEAAWEKFHGEMAADDCLGIYMPKKGPAKITDSGHLILPWRVHLTDCGITVAGRHSDVAGMCCNVTELDLTHNDITSLEVRDCVSFVSSSLFYFVP